MHPIGTDLGEVAADVLRWHMVRPNDGLVTIRQCRHWGVIAWVASSEVKLWRRQSRQCIHVDTTNGRHELINGSRNSSNGSRAGRATPGRSSSLGDWCRWAARTRRSHLGVLFFVFLVFVLSVFVIVLVVVVVVVVVVFTDDVNLFSHFNRNKERRQKEVVNLCVQQAVDGGPPYLRLPPFNSQSSRIRQNFLCMRWIAVARPVLPSPTK